VVSYVKLIKGVQVYKKNIKNKFWRRKAKKIRKGFKRGRKMKIMII
jgi:type II secretory pathway component PulF